MDTQELLDNATQIVMVYGVRLLVAVVILLVGRWIAGTISRLVNKTLQARGVDIAVSQFAGSLSYAVIFAFTIVAALSHIGVQTASMIAALGAAGLAIGLALQGSLSNFAAGILIIIFKPCRVGDYVDAGGVSGTVQDISLLATCLLTPDNKRIMVPNAGIMSGPITNYSAMPTRRVDLVIGISYDADIAQAKTAIEEILNSDERVLKDPAYTVAVVALADSSVNLVVRPWVEKANYWPVYFELTEGIKNKLDSIGVGIPYPQMDVHFHKEVEG